MAATAEGPSFELVSGEPSGIKSLMQFFFMKVTNISDFAYSNLLVEGLVCSRYNRSFTFSFFFETGEQAKNDHAAEIINRILDQSAWINIHMLPVSLFKKKSIEQSLVDGAG